MSRGYNPFEIAEFGEYIAVYLHMKSSSQAAVHKPAFLGTLDLKVNVSLLNGKGDVLVTQSSDLFTQNVINRRIGFDKFIKREDVLRAGSPYITDGALSFRVEVDVFYRGSEVAVSLSNPPPAWLTSSQLQMLRTSGLDYDVIVVGSDGLFNCHQAFLSERCGIFDEFFRSPELKAILANSNTAHPQRISIAGVDPALVSELVRFAYTDEITPKPHLAEKLLVIAHKYKTLGLKDLCEDILISGLDVLNAAELHQLANECEADKLKYQTLQLLCCLNAEDGKPGFPIVPAVVALNPEATVLYATGNTLIADEP
ncbi:hypothetical protein BV898_18940 [Hypsibius exemplaris]|uniref:BTB domain-containing protein n=1 Tax=Hypsibius exemplaris TaxID=2072580 RepID=A0A9X6NHU4_HYPEX|nr:hypothetical protein BV898_18940 [Hypsibius exemplaris]